MKNKIIKIVPIILHIIIIIMGSIAIISQAILPPNTRNALSTSGVNIFRYFTVDGNIFIVIASIVLLLSLLLKKQSKIIYLIHLMGVVSSLLIFLTVVIVLLPYYGSSLLKGYEMIVLHVTNPLICTISFLFFYKDKISIKLSILGIIPMAVYGFFALLFCITKVWVGNLIPYPFLEVYKNPWWESVLYVIFMYGGCMVLSIILSVLSRKLYVFDLGKKGLAISLAFVALLMIGVLLLLILI